MRALFLVAVVAAGCSANHDHAAPLQECDSSACIVVEPGPGGGAHTGRTGSPKDSGTTPADSGTHVSPSGDFTAKAGVYSDDSFTAEGPFAGNGTVELLGTGPPVTSSFSGATIDVASPPTSPAWAYLQKTSGSQDAMPTVIGLHAGVQDPNLAFVPRGVMDGIVSNLSATQSLATGDGHIVLEFVSGSQPVADVEVTAPQGSTAAYDAGSSYTDAFTATQARGIVILFNVSAVPFPGKTVAISYRTQGGASSGSVSAIAVSNATTVVVVPTG